MVVSELVWVSTVCQVIIFRVSRLKCVLCSTRCCTDKLETFHADWTNVHHGKTKGEGCGHVKSIYPPPPSHSPNPRNHPRFFLLTVLKRCFCYGLLFIVIVCLCMFVLEKILFWIAVLPLFWGKKLYFCTFGFLHVVFWLWCRCSKCVLFSLWCLGRKVFGDCIDSWIAFFSTTKICLYNFDPLKPHFRWWY